MDLGKDLRIIAKDKGTEYNELMMAIKAVRAMKKHILHKSDLSIVMSVNSAMYPKDYQAVKEFLEYEG